MEENKINPNRKVVIIGGSAGSLNALMTILPELPKVITFALVIVLHRKNSDDLTLEDLLKMKSRIPFKSIEDKTLFESGFLYVAPSNYHLLFEKDQTLALDTSEKVNYSRPSIDVSFESASEVYADNLVGILLSGSNSDGTQGLKAIQNAGGIIVVQDPEVAEMPFMPKNAILNLTPDYILKNEAILNFLKCLND